MLFLVSFNVYATPSFKVYYFDKFDKFVLFLNILTDYFTVSYCIVFLFCKCNFQTKSQFHVKWICRNKFIIIIIIINIIIIITIKYLKETLKKIQFPDYLKYTSINVAYLMSHRLIDNVANLKPCFGTKLISAMQKRDKLHSRYKKP